MTKGDETRKRILDIAQDSVLAKGFGATSIEEIIAATDLTKSGFFYHFKSKNDLAKALLARYVDEDERIYDELFGRARALMDDPLQAFLLGLTLLAEVFADLPNRHPRCLVATSCYYDRIFDREIQEINRQAALQWRQRFRATFDEIAAHYEPHQPIDLDHLADMVSAVMEGGIMMSKALKEPAVLQQQVLVLRDMVKLLFAPTPPLRAVR
ncbi:TetR/AcrR family transcriptional regulator [Humitalea sp. 24SJ18S-53]|uniref:TetR/AcrR family transcriptional regulator n=1 Tax=Humitalea sp. 24SJ18S-53 TaxID=3422307 RepID=UPI003D67F1F5